MTCLRGIGSRRGRNGSRSGRAGWASTRGAMPWCDAGRGPRGLDCDKSFLFRRRSRAPQPRAPPPQRRHPDPACPHSRRATRLACASRPHHGRAWDAQRSRGWRARAPPLRARWRGGRNGTASRRPERLPGPRAPRPVRAATRALSASRAAETPRLARPCKACTAGAAWSHGQCGSPSEMRGARERAAALLARGRCGRRGALFALAGPPLRRLRVA